MRSSVCLAIRPGSRALSPDRLRVTTERGFKDRWNKAASSEGSSSHPAAPIRDSAGQSAERAGDKLVEHQLDVQPTITIRSGARVRVLVSRDLVLALWTPK